ncbi:MAG TPA: helix-turn-helix transcriptional regulator, partial [Anaeromyxobacteraceae bacterium]|nr:helix-turn-helix transcriptional regulator [Anaeromyxobacteraceae bacterium]
AKALYGPGSLATYTLMDPEEAHQLVGRIEEAGRVLLDHDARARYDASLAAPSAPAPFAPSTPPAPTALPSAAAAVNGEARPIAPVIIPALPLERVVFGEDEDVELDADDLEADEEPAAATPREAPEAAAPRLTPVPAPIPLATEVVAPAARLLAAAAAAAGPADAIATPPRAPIPLRQEVPAPPPSEAPCEAPAAEAPAQTPLPREMAVVVPEGAAWTGDVLRQIREARGISLQTLAERTRVTRHHIENIEADRFDRLPAPVYLRGILMSVARELRLDGQKVARSYLERAGRTAAADGGLPIPRR